MAMTCKTENSFDGNIARVKFARKRATGIFTDFSLSMETAVASVTRAWEMLFDSICGGADGSIGELKDISSVIQKLSASSQRIQDMERRQMEKLKLADLDAEKQKLLEERENMRSGKLPNHIIEAVEEQLQLL